MTFFPTGKVMWMTMGARYIKEKWYKRLSSAVRSPVMSRLLCHVLIAISSEPTLWQQLMYSSGKDYGGNPENNFPGILRANTRITSCATAIMSGIVVRGAPPFPRFMFYVKATLIILSVAILALAAYATSIEDDIYSSSGVPEYLIFLVRCPAHSRLIS